MNWIKVRKKPVVVDAYQSPTSQVIRTLEGDMIANAGDWIIKGVDGELYPCKPTIFEKTYETEVLTTTTEDRIDVCLNDLRNLCHAQAKSLGWYDGYQCTDVEAMALAITELTEAIEEFREPHPRARYLVPKKDGNMKPEGYGVEIADAIIRLLDYCGRKNLDIQELILEKLEYNKTRGFRHGNKRV